MISRDFSGSVQETSKTHGTVGRPSRVRILALAALLAFAISGAMPPTVASAAGSYGTGNAAEVTCEPWDHSIEMQASASAPANLNSQTFAFRFAILDVVTNKWVTWGPQDGNVPNYYSDLGYFTHTRLTEYHDYIVNDHGYRSTPVGYARPMKVTVPQGYYRILTVYWAYDQGWSPPIYKWTQGYTQRGMTVPGMLYPDCRTASY